MDFTTAFENVVGHEGGYGADPQDSGNWTSGQIGVGELRGTKFGISAASYPKIDIKHLDQTAARVIYQRDFWDPLRLSEVRPALRYYLFDTAVNCGAAFAAQSLQRAAGVLPDGQIGPKTILAVKAASPHQLLRLMVVERSLRYANHRKVAHFGPGWFARLHDVVTLTLVQIDPRLNAAKE